MVSPISKLKGSFVIVGVVTFTKGWYWLLHTWPGTVHSPKLMSRFPICWRHAKVPTPYMAPQFHFERFFPFAFHHNFLLDFIDLVWQLWWNLESCLLRLSPCTHILQAVRINVLIFFLGNSRSLGSGHRINHLFPLFSKNRLEENVLAEFVLLC